ncbi:MAG: thermonuclease family protein [Actinomycetota bacterium]
MTRRLAVAGLVALLLVAAGLAARRLFPREPERDACRGVEDVAVPPGNPAPAALPAGTQPALVVRVVDGDGICVRPLGAGPLAGDAVHEVRLVGINAPGAGRCGSEAAARFARERIGVGTVVHLLADAEDRDRYGRALRYAWDGAGGFFNVEAVREGAARALVKAPNERYAGELRAAEAEARDAGTGVWDCLPWKLIGWLRRPAAAPAGGSG